MRFKGDVLITDPCYIMKRDQEDIASFADSDWCRCKCGGEMEALGINTYITSMTLYGDWSCSVFNIDTHEKIGEFCADSALVGVFLLEEVLKYNPNFDYHINRPWTTALIKNYDGEIEIKVASSEYLNKNDEIESEVEIRVVGKGNVNFYTTQTGL